MGLRELVEAQLPVKRDRPEGQDIKVRVPPVYGNPMFPQGRHFSGPAIIRKESAGPGDKLPKEENPYYNPNELNTGNPGLLSLGGNKPPLDYKNARDVDTAQALWQDSSVLKQYANDLYKKGLSDDDISEILMDLAKQQKAARAARIPQQPSIYAPEK